MKTTTCSFSICAALLLSACVTPPEPAPEPPAKHFSTINIMTLPPGALIYKNAEFLGIAPLQHTVETDAEGNWKQGARFQAYVPHDTANYEEAVYFTGYAVPKNILLRVPGYERWYSSMQQFQPRIY